MTKAGSLTLLLLLAACGAQPKHVNVRAEQSSQLAIRGGPPGAIISVDGIEAGRLINGKQAQISLIDGTHLVTIQHDGRELYRRTVFVQDGTRKVIDLR